MKTETPPRPDREALAEKLHLALDNFFATNFLIKLFHGVKREPFIELEEEAPESWEQYRIAIYDFLTELLCGVWFQGVTAGVSGKREHMEDERVYGLDQVCALDHMRIYTAKYAEARQTLRTYLDERLCKLQEEHENLLTEDIRRQLPDVFSHGYITGVELCSKFIPGYEENLTITKALFERLYP